MSDEEKAVKTSEKRSSTSSSSSSSSSSSESSSSDSSDSENDTIGPTIPAEKATATVDKKRKEKELELESGSDSEKTSTPAVKKTKEESGSGSDSEKTSTPAVKKTKEKSHSDSESENGCIGPSISEATEAAPVKKRKVLPYEKLYLDNLPNTECYEKSYMHRDTITHLTVTKTDFLVTGSVDGHVKFWKKQEEGIEFVKHFRSHLGPVVSLTTNSNGTYLCSASSDKSVKIFDVINFDMINMFKFDFVPLATAWVHCPGDPIASLAVSDADSNKIHIFDAQGVNTPLHTLDKFHSKPVNVIAFNAVFETAVSVDKAGILEYWQSPKNEYKFPAKEVAFESKLDTSLFEFARNKTIVTGIDFSPDGKKFAAVSTDRKVRIFSFVTGKLLRVYDESLARYTEQQQTAQTLPTSNMEFGRRMANERELEKSNILLQTNIAFDSSGYFVLYPTMLGIKVVNIETNRCANILGKSDNLRPLHVALFQGRVKKSKAAVTLEQEASENPALLATTNDPTLFCTAYKKQRFYLYSRRLPSDVQDQDRDIFNEKPSKEDIISVTDGQATQRIYDQATLHTTMGDVHIKLFGKECPKTVENFCVHSKNGYYNGHIFHRVIKGFMVQTGDPTGTGTGGQSIWGSDFTDEFVATLKHDKPYTVSMANAGPNTNGSQFFVTVLPTPWLDNKHTVFGRVFKGMEVVQNISSVKTNPKTDKPFDDVKIISINLS